MRVLRFSISCATVAAMFGFFGARAFGATENSPRARVTVENWDKGSALSHWVYTHVSEVFPSAVVRRGGMILDLPVQIRPEIGSLKLKNPDGSEQTLDQFVNNGPTVVWSCTPAKSFTKNTRRFSLTTFTSSCR